MLILFRLITYSKGYAIGKNFVRNVTSRRSKIKKGIFDTANFKGKKYKKDYVPLAPSSLS